PRCATESPAPWPAGAAWTAPSGPQGPKHSPRPDRERRAVPGTAACPPGRPTPARPRPAPGHTPARSPHRASARAAADPSTPARIPARRHHLLQAAAPISRRRPRQRSGPPDYPPPRPAPVAVERRHAQAARVGAAVSKAPTDGGRLNEIVDPGHRVPTRARTRTHLHHTTPIEPPSGSGTELPNCLLSPAVANNRRSREPAQPS